MPTKILPRPAYVIVQVQHEPESPCEIIQVMGFTEAHAIFDLLCKFKRNNYKRYGNVGGEWYIALYDPDPGCEWTFTVSVDKHGVQFTQDARPDKATRRRYFDHSILGGTD